MVLEKPPIGAACNGCGLCCRAQICALGSISLGLTTSYGERAPGPCPLLTPNAGGVFVCGLVLRPRDFAFGKGNANELREAAKLIIGAGAGCDDAGDDDRPEASEALIKVQESYVARVGIDRLRRAIALWFGVK